MHLSLTKQSSVHYLLTLSGLYEKVYNIAPEIDFSCLCSAPTNLLGLSVSVQILQVAVNRVSLASVK